MRRELPGDVWSVSAFESHCLQAALERARPFLDEAALSEISPWEVTLELEQPFQLTPTEWDRVFFEALVAAELARLWGDGPGLPCGCPADEHLAALRAFQSREINAAKRFAAARRPGSDGQGELPLLDQA